MQNVMNGKIGEYKIVSKLLLKGYDVFMPSVDNGTDLVLGNGKHIQIKSSYVGRFMFYSAKSKTERKRYGDSIQLEPHLMSNEDNVILWTVITDRFYIIPTNDIRGMHSIVINKPWDKYMDNWGILGKVDHDNISGNIIGRAGEYRVISELISRGYDVSLPIVDNGVDLYIDNQKGIQIKTAKAYDATTPYIHKSYNFNIKLSQPSKNVYISQGKHVKAHTLEGVDYIILWAIGDNFYIIPADRVRGKMDIQFTADHDKRTQVKWNEWLPYQNNWDVLKGILPKHRQRREYKCRKCGHSWQSLVPNPTRCPKCHTRWKVDGRMALCHCRRCGHNWKSYIKPNTCPKCQSHKWDVEKIDRMLDVDRMKELYLEGYSCKDIGQRLGFCTVHIWKAVKKLGIMRERIEALNLAWSRKKVGEIQNDISIEKVGV